MDSNLHECIDRLRCLDISDVTKFTFKGTKTFARVMSVYDADTITITFDVNGTCHSFSIRILDIDSPEVKASTTLESKVAKRLREVIKTLILDQIVYVEIHDYDKYGRLLADVFIVDALDNSNIRIADILLKYECVRKYTKDNLHKDEWTENELSAIDAAISSIPLSQYHTF